MHKCIDTLGHLEQMGGDTPVVAKKGQGPWAPLASGPVLARVWPGYGAQGVPASVSPRVKDGPTVWPKQQQLFALG